jgi:hypothetical protein
MMRTWGVLVAVVTALGCGNSESSDDDSERGGGGGASATGGSSSGVGGQSGSRGNGSGNEDGWSCASIADICACEPESGIELTPCTGYSCCIYWVLVQNGVEYPRCGCTNQSEAECEEQVNTLGTSAEARRADICPPP